MAKHYNETAEEVLQSLNVSSHGLTDEEVLHAMQLMGLMS